MLKFVALSLLSSAIAAPNARRGLITLAINLRHSINIPSILVVTWTRPTSAIPLTSGRIIGGMDAFSGEFPFYVRLFISDAITGTSLCGGSLISPSVVLTAAHCLYNKTITNIEAIAGKMHYHNHEATEQHKTTSKYLIHEKFSPEISNENDIALLLLDTPFSLNNYVDVIYPPENISYSEVNVTAIGFGYTTNNGPRASILQKVTLKTIRNSDCGNNWNWLTSEITPNMICTAPKIGNSVCFGDSGGSLAISEGPFPILIGITSFGYPEGCDHPLGPNIFVRVSHYVKWVNDKLSQISSQ